MKKINHEIRDFRGFCVIFYQCDILYFIVFIDIFVRSHTDLITVCCAFMILEAEIQS